MAPLEVPGRHHMYTATDHMQSARHFVPNAGEMARSLTLAAMCLRAMRAETFGQRRARVHRDKQTSWVISSPTKGLSSCRHALVTDLLVFTAPVRCGARNRGPLAWPARQGAMYGDLPWPIVRAPSMLHAGQERRGHWTLDANNPAMAILRCRHTAAYCGSKHARCKTARQCRQLSMMQ